MSNKIAAAIVLCLLPLDCNIGAGSESLVDGGARSGDAATDASVFERAQDPSESVSVTGGGAITLAGTAQADLVDGARDVARFNNPANLALGPDGNLYVADNDNSCIRIVRPSGQVLTYTRQEGFSHPFGLAFAPDGTLYVQTDGNDLEERSFLTGTLWRIERRTGHATPLARNLGRPRGLVMLPDGRVAMADNEHHVIRIYDPSTAVVTDLAGVRDQPGFADGRGVDARFNRPYDMVVAGDRLLVADQNNHRIRAITIDGQVSTYAGSGEVGSANGTSAEASFNSPQALAIDATGNVFVTEVGGYRVRRISPDGDVTTVAGAGTGGYMDGEPMHAQFFGLEGLDVSADGRTLFIADGNRGSTEPSHRVRRVVLSVNDK
jgi:sugar lactone lactonase YvrE